MKDDRRGAPLPGDGELEAWLDGRLEGGLKAGFESRLRSEPELEAEVRMQRAIDASLRRSFAVPTRLAPHPPTLIPTGSTPSGAIPRPAPGSSSAGLGHWGWRAAAAVAASVIAFVWLSRGGTPPEDARSADLALGTIDPHVPDLERLYDQATRTLSPARAACSDGEELHRLENSLAQRCGDPLVVRPDAAAVLQGPFDSPEWPTGTVLTGYPDGPLGQPSVLVAECESELSCCLRIDLPETSSLQLFTWRVGDVFLTEITPLGEPRLLEYFQTP